jgi:hypothetical protein
MHVLVFMLFSLIAFEFAQAQELAHTLHWYDPFLIKSPLKNQATVMVFGRIKPGTKVRIDPHQVFEIEASPTDGATDSKSAGTSSSTIANDQGYFRVSLKLPYGQVQVPFYFLHEEKEVAIVVIFSVSTEKASLLVPLHPDPDPIALWRRDLIDYVRKAFHQDIPIDKRLKGSMLKVGLGSNYQIYEQTASTGTNVKFQDSAWRSVGVDYQWLARDWLAGVNYSSTPGTAAQPSEPFQIDERTYVWQALEAAAGLRIFKKTMRPHHRLGVTLGVQWHWQPFFSFNYDNMIKVEEMRSSAAALGVHYLAEPWENQFIEIDWRYHLPFRTSVGGGHTIKRTPQFAFDGSITYLHALKKNRNLMFGLIWHGQWDEYKYEFFNSSTGLNQSGNQRLFHTSMLLTLAYNFQ